MKQLYSFLNRMLPGLSAAVLMMAITGQAALADNPTTTTRVATPQQAALAPPPVVNARGYVLMDAKTGEILAQKNIDNHMAPASLTKIMTVYLIAEALKNNQIHLTDKVTVSKDAWRTGGSRMFIQVGTQVPVQALVDGIVIVSGNDAAVAMAEYIGGTQQSFIALMNQAAAKLGMVNTHFADVNGLPAADHYTTPRDLAVLTRALINDFPDYYNQWFHQKWFTYNNIRQPNRNHLLWSDPSVDGLKTGYTQDAGYCLVASAQRNDMRLISVVMGAPSIRDRTSDSQALLNWGYRFYETHKLYGAHQSLVEPRVWMGGKKFTALGVNKDIYVTIPTGQYQNIRTSLSLNNNLKAPILKGQTYGMIDVTLNDKPLFSTPLVALQDNPRGNLANRTRDHLARFFSHWLKNTKGDKQA